MHTLEHITSDGIAVGMDTETEVAVQSVNQPIQSGKTFTCYPLTVDNGTIPVSLTDAVHHATEGSVGSISSPRLDDGTDKLHAFFSFLQIDLVRMDGQMQLDLHPNRQIAVQR